MTRFILKVYQFFIGLNSIDKFCTLTKKITVKPVYNSQVGAAKNFR